MTWPQPLPPATEIPFGDLDMWRSEIAETAVSLAMRANMVADYAALRDDFGLTRTLRLMTVEMRHALSICADLDDQKNRQRERQEAAPAPSAQQTDPRRATEWA